MDMLLTKDEKEARDRWQAAQPERAKFRADVEKTERERNRLMIASPSKELDSAELNAIRLCTTEIKRLIEAEREAADKKLQLLTYAAEQLKNRAERSGTDPLDELINPVAERLKHVDKRVSEIEREVAKLQGQRAEKEIELERLHGRLKKTADEKRKRMIREMLPLLVKAQCLCREADEIFFTCRD